MCAVTPTVFIDFNDAVIRSSTACAAGVTTASDCSALMSLAVDGGGGGGGVASWANAGSATDIASNTRARAAMRGRRGAVVEIVMEIPPQMGAAPARARTSPRDFSTYVVEFELS